MSQNSPAWDIRSEGTGSGSLATALSAAFRSSPTATALIDARQAENPILFANDALLELTGYTRAEVLGRKGRFLPAPDAEPDLAQRFDEALAAGKGLAVEFLSYTKDRQPFWSAMALSPVEDEFGGLSLFVATLSDVSDQQRLEGELIEQRKSFEAELRRVTERFEAALQEKAALLHEVDHRIKNSLQVISSLMLLKSRRLDDEAARRALHNMAERIGALSTVHRLLNSTGDPARFDVKAFVADLSADLLGAVRPGQIEVDLQVEPATISASKATPLSLILSELLTNAIRHAFPDGRNGRIQIGAARVDGELRIVIADDGVGLGGEPASGAFGRTLTDMLVRQLRGRIAIEDAAPGTRAVVHIPLNAGEVDS